MTLNEIEKSDKTFLTPNDISEVLGSNPQNIRLQAQADPDRLGFPVSVLGNRVKIPRAAFLYWYKRGRPIIKYEGDIFEPQLR